MMSRSAIWILRWVLEVELREVDLLHVASRVDGKEAAEGLVVEIENCPKLGVPIELLRRERARYLHLVDADLVLRDGVGVGTNAPHAPEVLKLRPAGEIGRA